MKHQSSYLFLLIVLSHFVAAYDGSWYDSSDYTECRAAPEAPLYNGGLVKNQKILEIRTVVHRRGIRSKRPAAAAFVFHNLTASTIYCFSSWVKIKGLNSTVIQASLTADNTTFQCVGSVVAKRGCWSFLKGGFVLDSPSNFSILYFQNSGKRNIKISIASPSLQPFTQRQWRINQQYKINTERKRAVTIHTSDVNGNRLQGAEVVVKQISRDFPFGSAIAKTILENSIYQDWFIERFNAVVFENELKWYYTEPQPGIVNYTVPDQMLQFVRANQLLARGHNIFWENPKYNPTWVRNLTAQQLRAAVESRIQSLMSRYRNEFVHWDVNNEMLHFAFYEQRLGPNASLQFFETAHRSDPLATLFMNEYNVVETCDDLNSTADAFISRLRQLQRNGVSMDGIGLQGHFAKPNPPLIRAVLDKLAKLDLPIWLTEVDISNTLGEEEQAEYLEVVLREGFSHPSVNGIILWTALDATGCYRMCLTDNNFRNLPAGDIVDKLLKEWQTGDLQAHTDNHGTFSFYGFLGEYEVTVNYGYNSVNSTFSLCRGDETKHVNIQL